MRRVLIVDDDPRVRAALTALITGTTDLSVTAAVGTAGTPAPRWRPTGRPDPLSTCSCCTATMASP